MARISLIVSLLYCVYVYTIQHRRRITTEEKAKVVAAVCETELILLIAALAIFYQDDLKKEMNSSYA